MIFIFAYNASKEILLTGKTIDLIHTQEYFLRHAYFKGILILRCHGFGKCLFSSHAYFRASAYYQEFTVCGLLQKQLY